MQGKGSLVHTQTLLSPHMLLQSKGHSLHKIGTPFCRHSEKSSNLEFWNSLAETCPFADKVKDIEPESILDLSGKLKVQPAKQNKKRHKPQAHRINIQRSSLYHNRNHKGYCIAASLVLFDSSTPFFFLGVEDFFVLLLALVDGFTRIALKEWNQSWTLMISPCSWARMYLDRKKYKSQKNGEIEKENSKL